MLQQTIELLRLDDRTGEAKVFLRRVVREHITLDALKKRANRLGLKYDVKMVRIIYNNYIYHRVVFQENGVSVLGGCWHKERLE